MKLVCPACGAAASAEIFVNDATARQALKLAAEMPADVGKRALGYVGMFRNPDKESRGLRWDKALRLLHEINLLIQQSEIQLRGKASRKCTPGIWAQAMERMIERPPSRLPLTSHGYLTAIAWEIANEADKAADARRIAAEHSGAYQREVRKEAQNDFMPSAEQVAALKKRIQQGFK